MKFVRQDLSQALIVSRRTATAALAMVFALTMIISSALGDGVHGYGTAWGITP